MSAKPPGGLERTGSSVTQSQLWRSLFRHGSPDTPVNQSRVMMGHVFVRPVKVSRKAMTLPSTGCLGGLFFFLSFFLSCFLVLTGLTGLTLVLTLVLTGLFLMCSVMPEPRVASASIPQIKGAVAFGALVRNR